MVSFHRKKLISIIMLALVWTFNAAYLTYYAFQSKADVPVYGWWWVWSFACDYNNVISCSWVFNQDFAWILWLPFSAIALIVYPVLAIFATLWLFWKIKNHFKILFFMALGGLIFNGYVITNEYFANVYCALCLICTVIIIAIGVMSKIADCKDKKSKKS